MFSFLREVQHRDRCASIIWLHDGIWVDESQQYYHGAQNIAAQGVRPAERLDENLACKHNMLSFLELSLRRYWAHKHRAYAHVSLPPVFVFSHRWRAKLLASIFMPDQPIDLTKLSLTELQHLLNRVLQRIEEVQSTSYSSHPSHIAGSSSCSPREPFTTALLLVRIL